MNAEKPGTKLVVTQKMVDAIVARAKASDFGLDSPVKGPDSYKFAQYGSQDLNALAMLLVNAHFAKYDIISVVAAALQEIAERVTPQLLPEVTWMPIETAPKNGEQRIMIAHISNGDVTDIDFDAVFAEDRESWEIPEPYWYWKSAFGRVEEPTHWAPLPAIPGIKAQNNDNDS